jgi:hypothetical protein
MPLCKSVHTFAPRLILTASLIPGTNFPTVNRPAPAWTKIERTDFRELKADISGSLRVPLKDGGPAALGPLHEEEALHD